MLLWYDWIEPPPVTSRPILLPCTVVLLRRTTAPAPLAVMQVPPTLSEALDESMFRLAMAPPLDARKLFVMFAVETVFLTSADVVGWTRRPMLLRMRTESLI